MTREINTEKLIIGVFGFCSSVFMFWFAYYIVHMDQAWSSLIGMLFIFFTIILMALT